jgi:hypothetical protein
LILGARLFLHGSADPKGHLHAIVFSVPFYVVVRHVNDARERERETIVPIYFFSWVFLAYYCSVPCALASARTQHVEKARMCGGPAILSACPFLFCSIIWPIFLSEQRRQGKMDHKDKAQQIVPGARKTMHKYMREGEKGLLIVSAHCR